MCQSPTEDCAPEPDEIYAKAYRLNTLPRRRKVTNPPQRFETWRKVVVTPFAKRLIELGLATLNTLTPRDHIACEGCGDMTRCRLCPHCHYELPDNVDTHTSLRVAVIGPPAAGKTHFVMVQAEFLERCLGGALGLTVRPVGRTRQLVADRARDQIFQQRKILPKTHRFAVTAENREPLVFELTSESLGLALNLVLFDLSGEDCLDEKALSHYGSHILNSDAFIVLAPTEPVATAEVVDVRIRDAIESLFAALASRGTAMRAQEQAPIALVVAKIDRLAVRGELDPRLADGIYYTKKNYVENVTATVSRSREMILKSDFGTALVHLLEKSSRSVGYFAVASLGSEPDASGYIPTINPHRVEEPLLWLLHTAGAMKAAT